MRKLSVNIISVYSILIIICAEFLNVITQVLPIGLRYKLIISMIFVLICYVFMIGYCVRHKQIATVLFMIIVLSILFYYGQHILAIFNPNYLFLEQGNHVLDGKLKNSSIIRSTYLAIECLLVVFAGYNSLVNKKGPLHNDEIEISNYDVKLQSMKVIGWTTLLISLYPTIYYLLAQYRANIMFGYLERRAMEADPNYYYIIGVNPIVGTMARFFLIALYALLIAYKGNRFKTLINVLVIIYCVLYYITGSRYGLVKLLIILFFIEFLWVNPIGKQNIKKYVLIALIMGIAFTVGTVFRASANSRLGVRTALSQVNMSAALWESGITFTSISNIIENCPSVIDYFYGKSVIGAILQCLPKSLRFGFFDKYTLQVSAVFAPLYYHVTNHGYGSSFIAEAYYNFGPLMGFFMLIYGQFLRAVQDKMENARSQHSPYTFLILAVLCGSLVYGVRNDLSSIPREMLSTIIIFVVLVFLVEKIITSFKH